MSKILDDLKYSEDHEWAKTEGEVITVGITDHAQSELGDIVFVELPEVGDTLDKGDSFGTIEAVKTVAELYAPTSGEIVEVNEALADEAETINSDPYGQGWIVKIKLNNASELDSLMDAAGYSSHIS